MLPLRLTQKCGTLLWKTRISWNFSTPTVPVRELVILFWCFNVFITEQPDRNLFVPFAAASTQVEDDNDDKSEDSSETESEEDGEAKPIQLLEILQDMKLKAVQLMENVSSYFGGLFRSEYFTENGEERERTLLNDPTSLFGLAVCVIFMVVMKRA